MQNETAVSADEESSGDAGRVVDPIPPLLNRSHNKAFVRNRRKSQLISHLLVAPLVLFILMVFVLPIFSMLLRSIENQELRQGFPNVTQNIALWRDDALPDPQIFMALALDLKNDDLRVKRAGAARRLNYEIPGFRTLIMGSARKQKRLELPTDPMAAKQQLIEMDERWGQISTWQAIRRASGSYTSYYLLAALDLRVDDAGSVVRVDPEQRIFIDILLRTLWISFVVATSCLLIAYPVANYMVTARPLMKAITSLSILLPFWTSLLVRTSAWIVVLQHEGIVNDSLAWLRVISSPLELIFNRFSVYVAMIHIMLPFMVLPLFSVMVGIPQSYMRAGASLGAKPMTAFRTIYLPLTLPGIGAGFLLTFTVSIGYYITPALVGGADDQMIGYFVAFFTNTRLNWGMASALCLTALLCIVAFYATLGRVIGIDKLVGIQK